MEKDSKPTLNLKCKFHNTGYCKFGETCRKRHYSKVCHQFRCKEDCPARHPKLCKMEINCRFFKKGICAYKHIVPANYDKNHNDEIDHLKRDILHLTKELNFKQEQFDKIIVEKTELIEKLSNENREMENLINEIKQSHIDDLEKKDTQINALKDENDYKNTKIIEMSKENFDLMEQTKIRPKGKTIIEKNVEDTKLPDDYQCDKCEYSTSSLGILVKHKADEHKPIVACDKCEFKAIKKSDLHLHLLFKH